MEEQEAFAHEPLDRSLAQIRLVSVNPEADGPIRCTLRRINLHADRTPDYRALSYNWGPPDPVRQIYIDGLKHIVRSNLFEFLLAVPNLQREKYYQ